MQQALAFGEIKQMADRASLFKYDVTGRIPYLNANAWNPDTSSNHSVANSA